MEWILFIVIGLAAGILGSLLGLGGGIIIVPSLLALSSATDFFTITPQVAAGTSLVVTIITAISATLAYMKHKTVDYVSGIILCLGAAPGSFFGAYINKQLDMSAFEIYFGSFLLFVSFVLYLRKRGLTLSKNENPIIKRTFKTPDGMTHSFGFNPYIAIPAVFFIGFTSGLFGIGGGSLMVPLMVMLFAFPPHVAIPTSMFIIFFSSTMGSVQHIILDNVNWLYVLLLAPGAFFGAKIGAKINTMLQGETVVTILRIFLIIVGVQMIVKNIM